MSDPLENEQSEMAGDKKRKVDQELEGPPKASKKAKTKGTKKRSKMTILPTATTPGLFDPPRRTGLKADDWKVHVNNALERSARNPQMMMDALDYLEKRELAVIQETISDAIQNPNDITEAMCADMDIDEYNPDKDLNAKFGYQDEDGNFYDILGTLITKVEDIKEEKGQDEVEGDDDESEDEDAEGEGEDLQHLKTSGSLEDVRLSSENLLTKKLEPKGGKDDGEEEDDSGEEEDTVEAEAPDYLMDIEEYSDDGIEDLED